jgi:hypothetical protein
MDSSGHWTVLDLKIRGAPLEEEVYNWQEKCCNFFRAAVQEVAMNIIPDFDALIARELTKEKTGDQSGGGGGKKPKVRGQQLLGIRKGGGGF